MQGAGESGMIKRANLYQISRHLGIVLKESDFFKIRPPLTTSEDGLKTPDIHDKTTII